jgi:hypothetical protein
MIIGYIYLKRPFQIKTLWFSVSKKVLEYRIQNQEKKFSHSLEMEKDLNSILDKINREGFKSLTREEEERLYKNSKNLSKGKKKD